MRSLKRLEHRNWLTLRDLWINHLPAIDFAVAYPSPTLWELAPIEYPPLNAGGVAECNYVQGVREAVLREAILLVRKFIYCGTLLPTLSGVGKNTWTAVAAYEASFYGAKAVCYLLGFANLSKSSNLYLDVFCETERKVGKIKVKFYDTLRIHKLEERLNHKMLWGMTERLLDTTTFEGELLEIQTQLKIFDWDSFTSFRNNVYYDGSFWPLSATMQACDLTTGVHQMQLAEAAQLDTAASSSPFAGEYFAAATLFRKLIIGMLQTIADVAPAIKLEVEAFNALTVHRGPAAAASHARPF
jgi:hypothetical protein